MAEEIEKNIKDVSINYEDGTRDSLQFYALVGQGGDTWFSVMSSPPKNAAKVKMNNMMVEMSVELVKSVKQAE